MNDLASHIFNMGNAMNRAKAAEIAEYTPKKFSETLARQKREDEIEAQTPKGQELVCCDCRTLTSADKVETPAVSSPKGRWDTPSDNAGCDQCGTNDREPGSRICKFCRETQRPDIAPTIAKIPLRAEVRDMLIAADMYQEHADLLANGAELHEKFAKQNREEAARLEQMARDARAQAENLERMANL